MMSLKSVGLNVWDVTAKTPAFLAKNIIWFITVVAPRKVADLVDEFTSKTQTFAELSKIMTMI